MTEVGRKLNGTDIFRIAVCQFLADPRSGHRHRAESEVAWVLPVPLLEALWDSF